ncbi:hypothetical protein K504DRAFT_213446 [Pleomassaria siparia CBS 279.74]|uniref:Uncharacterized protein n=1 Tax=Pleomassaria siparia CBS 279.74 TaxID=1314801 RepID=A0A6G1JPS7_9PLEO|nr:hypothetical protein K504DRAFT_213446 [Pleomassaria siparia CBS 279.74]
MGPAGQALAIYCVLAARQCGGRVVIPAARRSCGGQGVGKVWVSTPLGVCTVEAPLFTQGQWEKDLNCLPAAATFLTSFFLIYLTTLPPSLSLSLSLSPLSTPLLPRRGFFCYSLACRFCPGSECCCCCCCRLYQLVPVRIPRGAAIDTSSQETFPPPPSLRARQ